MSDVYIRNRAQAWLGRRGLLNRLRLQRRPFTPFELDHWRYYAYSSPRNVQTFGLDPPGNVHEPERDAASGWRQAFHGTWFYGIWNILERGLLLPRDNEEVDRLRQRQHVHVTPGFGTAKAFAPPHDLFGIGVYECVILELRVHEHCIQYRRTKCGGSYTQWRLTPEDVYIVGVWFGVNVGNEVGCTKVEAWREHLEILPAGRQVWSPNPPHDEWWASPDKSAPRGRVWPEMWTTLTNRNVVDTIGAMWDPNA